MIVNFFFTLVILSLVKQVIILQLSVKGIASGGLGLRRSVIEQRLVCLSSNKQAS